MKSQTVNMEFYCWDQVVALCDLRLGGPVRLDAMCQADVEFDEDVTVALSMPDGFTMHITGHVVALVPESIGGSMMVPKVELTEFSHTRARALRALAAPVRDASDRIALAPAQQRSEVPRLGSAGVAKSKSESTVSQLIRGNRRLRTQIEQLAGHMTPLDK